MLQGVYGWILFFFFSSRRRHTRCALVTGVQTCALPISRHAPEGQARAARPSARSLRRPPRRPWNWAPRLHRRADDRADGIAPHARCRAGRAPDRGDRKSVASGKSVYVSVDLGGARIITQQYQAITHNLNFFLLVV